jgi:hypothetical protein
MLKIKSLHRVSARFDTTAGLTCRRRLNNVTYLGLPAHEVSDKAAALRRGAVQSYGFAKAHLPFFHR